ncbi:MAG: CDP-archaeol synthase [Phycisphaeraceae bacterium]|nr:CDP-archaeol synthase [Phycisphaeraceae bacterium]
MLRHRLIFGPLMIAGFLLLLLADEQLGRIVLAGTWYQKVTGRPDLPQGLLMLGLFLVLIVPAARELCRMFHAEQVQASPTLVAISGILGCLLMYMLPVWMQPTTMMAVYASFMVGLFLLSLIKHSWAAHRTDGAVTVAAVTMFALIYLGTLPGFYLAIRRWHSAWLIAAIILVTKSCDIGAYFTGSAIGKRKLIPWLSPGKTWEGLIGGVLFSGVVATVICAITNAAGSTHYPLWYVALCGLLIGAFGQFGDLVASLFKRDAGIKDSGNAIPGFGGIIDVIDSPIVAAPLAYWLVRIGETLI